MSSASVLGIHHVTAITADAQKNIDFYTGVLGQRLVKLTVNFDDPSSYHLYYGDENGSPGSIMTFFAWPGAFEGRKGPPQVTVTAYAAPRASVKHWRTRLSDAGVKIELEGKRFDDGFLAFKDPDNLKLEIVFSEESDGTKLSRFHSVTISEEGYERTAKLLSEVMGFEQAASEQNRFRFVATNSPRSTTARSSIAGQVVDVLCVPDSRHGTIGAGAVHHVAFRTSDDAQQLPWRETLTKLGHNVSPVMDRNYFHSIYFREPGGVLFEIATDPPGFAVDEPAAHLGEKLTLPAWYEKLRPQITRSLPAVKLPSGAQVGGAS